MGQLRTPETEKRYHDFIAAGKLEGECVICQKEPTRLFSHWKIVTNDFPYDKVFIKHDMIVPLRHANQESVSQEEWMELNEIKKTYINDHYDWTMESTAQKLSIPSHFHIHLVVAAE